MLLCFVVVVTHTGSEVFRICPLLLRYTPPHPACTAPTPPLSGSETAATNLCRPTTPRQPPGSLCAATPAEQTPSQTTASISSARPPNSAACGHTATQKRQRSTPLFTPHCSAPGQPVRNSPPCTRGPQATRRTARVGGSDPRCRLPALIRTPSSRWLPVGAMRHATRLRWTNHSGQQELSPPPHHHHPRPLQDSSRWVYVLFGVYHITAKNGPGISATLGGSPA